MAESGGGSFAATSRAKPDVGRLTIWAPEGAAGRPTPLLPSYSAMRGAVESAATTQSKATAYPTWSNHRKKSQRNSDGSLATVTDSPLT